MFTVPNSGFDSRRLLLAVLALGLLPWADPCRLALFAQIKPAEDAPQPLPADESLRRFKLPPGFRIELVAAEPMLADPVTMAFDARGRIVVGEIHGYNLEGHYDVTELNKTGVLDLAVRRIPAPQVILEKAARETYGTVKILEDTDGDGRMDRVSVLADRLPPCYGVIPARDGIVALCAPDIVFLADRDGDGRAEVRETLFTGFGVGELWTRISNPQWGVDNWIYAACGAGSAGTITGPRLSAPVRLGNTGFRFKPDGTRFEPVSGGTSGFGLALGDWDDRFLVSNQQHALHVAPLEHRYLARNPHFAAPDTVINISTYGHPAKVYPIAPPDPWRLKRSLQPEWVKFYGAAEASMGLVTAACAPLIYRADQFPPEFQGGHFSCECAYNLLHFCRLEPAGASFRAFSGFTNAEFLASTEQWFRPVNLALGPDGALYIVDMYREIIEDYSAIPRYLQQQYGLIAGHNRGRIWRVAYGEKPGVTRDLAGQFSGDLVAALSSRNAWRRLTAQRLLLERGDRGVAGALAGLFREGAFAPGRLHALYALEGLGALEPAMLKGALEDPHPGIRLHALRLAEQFLPKRPSLVEKVLSMAGDSDVRVRLQLAFTLGETADRRRFAVLASLARKHGEDRWLQAAIVSSVPNDAAHLAGELLASTARIGQGHHLLKPLAATVGARREAEEISRLLQAVTAMPPEQPAMSTECLGGLMEGLRRGEATPLDHAPTRAALRQLLTNAAPEVRALALQIAGLLKVTQTPEMSAGFEALAQIAMDDSRPLNERGSALDLLASGPFELVKTAAGKLLDPRQPLDLQLAVVGAIAATDDPASGPLLLADWNRLSPKVQAAALDAIFRQQRRLAALLDAIESGHFPKGALDALRRSQLLAWPDDGIRRRATVLYAKTEPPADTRQMFDRYRGALAGPRNAAHGETLFVEHCAKCHSVNGQGGKIGPDMGGTKGRAEETLLNDILLPSDQLTAGYRSYTVITRSGDIYTGILSAETATSITLPGEIGTDEVVLRKDIRSLQVSDVSLMPANFSEVLQPQDIADILGYLRAALGSGDSAVVALFEDDPQFARLLEQGDGRVEVVTNDVRSGQASLQVWPPQRFADRIPGWNYRIVQNPGPGEYRFLRFSWKSPQGRGVMLEFSANGQWPPPDKPLRRYYCGQNTTGWQARQVSPDMPRDWTVVTVDLWQDFGDFTLTGLAPTAMGAPALFDGIYLMRTLGETMPVPSSTK